jgi:hypothetical protein
MTEHAISVKPLGGSMRTFCDLHEIRAGALRARTIESVELQQEPVAWYPLLAASGELASGELVQFRLRLNSTSQSELEVFGAPT